MLRKSQIPAPHLLPVRCAGHGGCGALDAAAEAAADCDARRLCAAASGAHRRRRRPIVQADEAADQHLQVGACMLFA